MAGSPWCHSKTGTTGPATKHPGGLSPTCRLQYATTSPALNELVGVRLRWYPKMATIGPNHGQTGWHEANRVPKMAAMCPNRGQPGWQDTNISSQYGHQLPAPWTTWMAQGQYDVHNMAAQAPFNDLDGINPRCVTKGPPCAKTPDNQADMRQIWHLTQPWGAQQAKRTF